MLAIGDTERQHNAPSPWRSSGGQDERWHGKEVHRGDGLAMIGQKGCPSLCRLGIPRSFPHPALHTSFGNIEAEHFQFCMNSRGTPSRVLCDHAKDEFAQLLTDAFSSHTNPIPREPRPIQLEPGSVPTSDCFRLYKNQRLLPSRPQLPQDHPKQFSGSSKPRLRVLLFHDTELLPKS